MTETEVAGFDNGTALEWCLCTGQDGCGAVLDTVLKWFVLLLLAVRLAHSTGGTSVLPVCLRKAAMCRMARNPCFLVWCL
jgi:hypothetical protein